ncbi:MULTISPECIES: endonuclease V [unclassified Streptomyces]|uniref:endonuclease V n=1 Tax=unclassified Streptomyces TaxID=2593676 RepID=UPI002DD8D2D7|nr:MULTISPECIES: endonuclease V [unclassified Streptomyces]WSA91180.1 endonuclease V [Streptomyces sp. NBC_01795]WSB75505.1 endonuclease V [Streptomyces sp. NBC_01775]WSS16212.1 endonuclease V [Streptomyces sp. NBC_01186]WSS45030.1 endonuclease V [Streptomyces sp. NBC_01187]
MDIGDWPTTEAEAIAVQERLREAADLTGPGPGPDEARTVAGVDVAYADSRSGGATEGGSGRNDGSGGGNDGGGLLVAAAVVLDVRTLEVVEESVHVGTSAFPYVPGLLAFRELPSVRAALDGLTHRPDVLVCDGYGLAHPRRAGLAVHLGVLTGIPCYGVAKTPFVSRFEEPGRERGAWTPLTLDGERVGRALRTREAVKPVFVSVGSGISEENAAALTLRLTPAYRLPETTRHADHLAGRRLAQELSRTPTANGT